MNQELTDITVVLDRSGSMTSVRDDTVGGFNAFVAQQRAEGRGECRVTLVQFDDVVETAYASQLARDAPDLDRGTYVPRGSTALLDAVGQTIRRTGARYALADESQRPGKVLFVIVTDGGENSSKEFKGTEGRAKVFDMIKEHRDTWKWDFVFLGANQDAFAAGMELGDLGLSKTMSYASNAAGVGSAWSATGAYALRTRAAASAGEALTSNAFTQEDRDAQGAAGVKIP